MKLNRFALLALVATACTGDVGGKDTGTTTTTGECPAADVYNGPISIDIASADCDGDQLTYYVKTIGWTDGGYVFSQETGNTDDPYAQWADEHDLVSFNFGACEDFDELRRTVSDVTTLSDPLGQVQRNESTLFNCDSNVHIGNGRVMTYAFAVVDVTGAFADCIVYGDDPEGLKNDDFDRASDPTFDAGQCTLGTNTM